MLELITIALLQIASFSFGPTSAENATTQSSINSDHGIGGWGDGHITNADHGIGGWGDGH